MLQLLSLRRVGGRLALLAVWLQLILTLGHVDPADIYGYGHPVVSGHGVTQVETAPRTLVPLPSLSLTETADINCPLCASIALLASATLPDPIAPLPPAGVVLRTARRAAAEPAPPAEFLLFETRAPPLA
jgi:hypothetical protein